MLDLYVNNENSTLKTVVLGTSEGFGNLIPFIEDCYDPKSKESIKKGIYPNQNAIKKEFEAILEIFKKYHIEVIRPEKIENCNQVFARDVAFVIEDKFICSNIIEDREKEIYALQHKIIHKINPKKVINLPEDSHVEGGDVMLYNDYIFVGTYRGDDYSEFKTARTNYKAVRMLREYFPNKKVIAFELKKDNDKPRENILHLDCCFQPVGDGKAIIYKEGFIFQDDVEFIENLFGKGNLFEITQEEMYLMFPNILSISPHVVISEKKFTRLNNQLQAWGITVEEVPYAEISKMGGLLRCTTMPLRRER
ncbi:MAG: dimethylarginine dimethylaminohydrolase family protein [Flavobacteriales bacterium]